jgi:solute carrier family 35 protein F1/2
MSVSHGDDDLGSKHSFDDIGHPVSMDVAREVPKRPPIVYSSPGAFIKSFGQRWKSVWTRRFALSLLSGQVVSLCITCTSVTTTELVIRNWTIPTTQSFFLFVLPRPLSTKVLTLSSGTFRYLLSIRLTRYISVSTIDLNRSYS